MNPKGVLKLIKSAFIYFIYWIYWLGSINQSLNQIESNQSAVSLFSHWLFQAWLWRIQKTRSSDDLAALFSKAEALDGKMAIHRQGTKDLNQQGPQWLKKHQGDETGKKRFIHGFSEQFKAGHLRPFGRKKSASSILSKYCIYSFEVISAVLAAAAAGGGGGVVVVAVGILGHQQIDQSINLSFFRGKANLLFIHRITRLTFASELNDNYLNYLSGKQKHEP